MRAFAVVAGDEDFAFGDDDVDFTGGVGLGAVIVGDAGGVVGMEAIGVFVVVDGEGAVLEADTLAREGDDAFDDVLVFDAGGGFAGEGIASAAVGEDDDLAAAGDEFLACEVSEGDGEAVDDDAVVGEEGVFHARADDVVTAEDKGV